MSKSNPYATTQPVISQARGEASVDRVEEAPDGSVSEVLKWVDGDADRAALALQKERENNNRKSLVAKLEELVPASNDDAVREDAGVEENGEVSE